MGLDVSFNLAQAKAAGLVTQQIKNTELGSMEEASELDDYYYQMWLTQESTSVEVPGMDHAVWGEVYANTLSIRANKWGNVYAPLTAFLKRNNITWSEA